MTFPKRAMRTIKRYTNRKLYDSQERRYITLEELATLIRQGEEIEVRDHISGADLTTLVMMQTVLDQERREGSRISQEILADLLQSGAGAADRLRGSVHAFLDPDGIVDREISRRLDLLVAQSKLDGEEADRLRLLLLAPDMHAEAGDESPASATQSDVESLMRRIDELTRRIDDLL